MSKEDAMADDDAVAEEAATEYSDEKPVHPARLALRSITIGDMAGLFFKAIIAGIVAILPFAVVFLIIAGLAGWLR